MLKFFRNYLVLLTAKNNARKIFCAKNSSILFTFIHSFKTLLHSIGVYKAWYKVFCLILI